MKVDTVIAVAPTGKPIAPLLLLELVLDDCALADDVEVAAAEPVFVPAACLELASETIPAKTDEAKDEASWELPPLLAYSDTTLASTEAVMAW